MEAKGNLCRFSEYPVGHGAFNYGLNGGGSSYLSKALEEIESFLAATLAQESANE